MKTAEFNALCNREHEQGGATVTKLYLTLESYHELLAEVVGDGSQMLYLESYPEPGNAVAGARLTAMVNPATRSLVDIGLAVDKALFADTAEVTRWVPVTQA